MFRLFKSLISLWPPLSSLSGHTYTNRILSHKSPTPAWQGKCDNQLWPTSNRTKQQVQKGEKRIPKKNPVSDDTIGEGPRHIIRNAIVDEVFEHIVNHSQLARKVPQAIDPQQGRDEIIHHTEKTTPPKEEVEANGSARNGVTAPINYEPSGRSGDDNGGGIFAGGSYGGDSYWGGDHGGGSYGGDSSWGDDTSCDDYGSGGYGDDY
ncbi:hypothetical protein HOY80DRAFT_1140357 [Tuber brumale]|nr:hypothetical protein HOY80DRAFT_1140357 [Tuber brumale]